MHRDQFSKGLLLGFAAFALYACSDASVKLIAGGIPPYESAFFGALFGLAALPFLRKGGDQWSDIFATVNRPLWLTRAVSSGLGTFGSVVAFTHLPMAEAFALIFLLPSFVTIMSVLFLKERIGLKRWGAVIVGFAGVLVVLRPGFRELSIGHLGAVLGGLSGAISIVVFRAIGPREKSISLYGAGMLGILAVCGVMMITAFIPPTAHQWLMLASYGLLAAFAGILLMIATRYASAVAIGPTQYSQMLWAILFGYLVFGDGIDLPMLVGILLIVGSGLLTLAREKVRHTPLPPSVAADARGPLFPSGTAGHD